MMSHRMTSYLKILFIFFLAVFFLAYWGPTFQEIVQPGLGIRWTQAVVFHNDGLLIAGSGGSLHVWNLTSEKLERKFRGHTSGVSSLDLSTNGKRLAAMSLGGNVRVAEFTSGKVLLDFVVKGGEAVAINGDGTQIATIELNQMQIQIWNVSDGQCLQSSKAPGKLSRDVEYDPDGSHIVVGGEGCVYYWDVKNKDDRFIFTEPDTWVSCVGFSPDGKLIAAGDTLGNLFLWDVMTRKLVLTTPAHTGRVEDICFDPTGKRLASAGEDGLVHLWSLENSKKTLSLPKHPGPVLAVSISHNGDYLATGCSDNSDGNPPQSLKVWSMENGSAVTTLPAR